MDDQTPDNTNNNGSGGSSSSSSPGRGSTPAAEPVRSRWTPKPEQILILESIFNSGMVNPPKDETVRIRKLLEKFGAVGDANVFYWFQNRRSRSRRRQRQLQAGLAAGAGAHQVGGAIMCEPSSSSGSSSTSTSNSSGGGGFFPCSSSASSSSSSFMGDDSADDLFSISRQMGFADSTQTPFIYSSDASQLHYQQPGWRAYSRRTSIFLQRIGLLLEDRCAPLAAHILFLHPK
ncbi:uncharacterized protein [Elaeis guineensis]|uniref:uncharacterized protein isoform X2 n=1 Tax=Elaeis guineensis var. tenera TaxID=51953 RepID=UPI003C6D43F5